MYATEYYEEVIQKMLLCGEKEGGYATYRCEDCGDKITVAFSCKSCFCLSCGKVYVDKWVEYIGEHLYDRVHYRHVVLTVPEDIRIYFYRGDRKRVLEGFMRCGVEMLDDAIKTYKKGKAIRAGYIVVLQLVGRPSKWNPHLHIIMTAGGLGEDNKWVELRYFPYELLHKKWQYYLLKMLKHEVKDERIKWDVDKMWRKYPDRFVSYWEKGDVPNDPRGLARYLAKYVVSPPIAIRRIMEYDGKEVKYWYIDHKTKKR